MSTSIRSRVAALGAACASVFLLAFAATASADTYTSGHYDLVLVPECDANTNLVSGGEFELEEHEVGPLEDEDAAFRFGAGNLILGFEVEWDADENCAATDVDVTLHSGSGTGTVQGGTFFAFSGTGVNYAPVVLDAANSYHDDPAPWLVSVGTDLNLAFTFTPSAGTPVSSSELVRIVRPS